MSKPSRKHRNTPAASPAPAPRRKGNTLLLQKGGLCVAIGLGVLLAPVFIKTPMMQYAVGGSAPVGWFALVLGIALIGQWAWQRRKDSQGH